MKTLFRLFLILLCSSTVCADATKGIMYITEQFPPFNFKEEGKELEGMNVEILEAMFKQMGSDNTVKNIRLLPLARGYSLAQDKSKENVLFSTTKTDARESLFKWVGPLSDATNALITLKGNPHQVDANDPGMVSKFKFGAIKNDAGEQQLLNSGVPHNSVSNSNNFEALMKQLEAKRIHVVSYNGTVAKWLLKKDGKSINDYHIVKEESIGQHYFAFNKNVSDEVVAAHQAALDAVKKDTALINAIQSKYK